MDTVYKVMDDGVKLAEFRTRAEAENYIREHKLTCVIVKSQRA